MSPREFIDDLQEQRSDYGRPQLAAMAASLLDTVSKDIYSESQRFVYELIQNADDAAGTSNNNVHFEFLSDSLIVSHNGIAFTGEDIEALTDAGASTKKADENKTGYKGIGFKSVFGQSNKVYVFSGGFQFRFDKDYHANKVPWQTIPIWTEHSELDEKMQTALTKNYQVSTILEIDNASSLVADLLSLLDKGQILLFLRKISKITVAESGTEIFSIEKKIDNQQPAFSKVSILVNNVIDSSWIHKAIEISIPEETKKIIRADINNPDKFKNASKTELVFAALLDDDKLKPLDSSDSLIYTYLPTKVTSFNFPFLVNGSFLTSASREVLHEDRTWNEWLFEQIGEKLVDWLVELSADGTFTHQVLHLIPAPYKDSSHKLKSAFERKFSAVIKTKPFVSDQSGSLKCLTEIIHDKTGLSQQSFINPESITQFVGRAANKAFSSNSFVHPQMEGTAKLKGLGVELFELDQLEGYFESKSFTSSHQVSENFELIRYFMQVSEKDSKGIWFQKLKTLPFIFDEKLKLYNPANGICFPTAVSSTELGNIPLIHPTVFEQIQKGSGVFEWLQKLGVKEPSEAAFVTNVLVPGLRAGNYITEDNYLRVTRYLFRLFDNNQLDGEMLECLRELPLRIKSRNVEFKEAQECFLSNKYSPQLPIEGVIPGISFVSEDYIPQGSDELKWNIFFRAIKVKDRVEVEIINGNNDLGTLRKITNPAWVDKSKADAERKDRFGYGEHNIIREVRIPSFLNLVGVNIAYSRLFWENILKSNIYPELTGSAFYKYGVGNGYNSFSTSIENYFPWYLQNIACIPTTIGEIKLPREVFVNNKEIRSLAAEYLPVLDTEVPVSGDWMALLGLQTRLGVENYLELLTKFSADTEEGAVKRSNIRKIGVVYNNLAALVSNMAPADKEQITKWAKSNELLGTDGRFYPADSIKWVQIDNFQVEPDRLTVIELHDQVKTNADGFEELMKLFEVQIINEFIPEFQNELREESLRNRLAEVLPYYSAIISRKSGTDILGIFNKLFEVLDETAFYNASEISLTFEHKGEKITGTKLNVYRQAGKFHFVGNWNRPLTKFLIVPELTRMFDIVGNTDELRLLLDLDNMEINEWMISKGYDLTTLPRSKKPRVHEVAIQSETGQQPAFPIPTASNDQNIQSSGSLSTFKPVLEPEGIDYSKIQISTASPHVTSATDVVVPDKIPSEEDRQSIGRWSEEFVHLFLKNNPGGMENIEWVNEKGETGLPYDFTAEENDRKIYFDVKGTPSSDKSIVYLSGAEWNFMMDKGDVYSLYRIYNAGQESARIKVITNPASQLLSKELIPVQVVLSI